MPTDPSPRFTEDPEAFYASVHMYIVACMYMCMYMLYVVHVGVSVWSGATQGAALPGLLYSVLVVDSLTLSYK